jgi:hypothetical protein
MAEVIQRNDFYSYNLTVEQKVNIDELIYTITPDDLPLLTGVGSDGMAVLPSYPVDNTLFSWLTESVPLPRATLNTTVNSSVTSIVLTAGEGVKFVAGDGIRIDDEVMVISSISTDTLTVVRGSAATTNTTAAAHTAGAEVIGLGSILIEGAVGSGSYQGRDKYFNYTQIWTRTVRASRTAQVIPKYGVPNELNRQTASNMLAVHLGIEQAAMYGVRHLQTADNRRQTGGLDYYVTSNVDSASTWLTVSSIEARQQVAFNAGGAFSYIVAQPQNFAALNNVSGNERVQTVTIDDPRRGRRSAMSVMTEYGEVGLTRSRWVKKNNAFCVNKDGFVKRVMDPLTLQKLAKTDDSDLYMMVTELGFEVKGQEHMAKFTALDATSAFPPSGV